MTKKELNDSMEILSDYKDLHEEFSTALKAYDEKLEDIADRRRELKGSSLPEDRLSEENEKLNLEEGEAETEFYNIQKRLFKSSIARKKAEIERLTKEKDRLFCGHKVYPNDPCPCGSGKKYKKCCGRGNIATGEIK